MPGALRRCLTSAAAAAAVSVCALPCPLASLSLVVCLPPPFFFKSSQGRHDTHAEPPCALSLPSPAFPPSAGDVAGPLSSQGSPAETSWPHFNDEAA